MIKKIRAITIIVVIFSITNLMLYPFSVKAEGIEHLVYKRDITCKKVEDELLRNNKEIRKIESSLYNQKENYEKSLNKEIDEDIWSFSDNYRRMLLLKTTELYPIQMEHAMLSTQENLFTTKKSLSLSLRNKYYELLLSRQDTIIKEMMYKSELMAHKLSEVKFSQGLISSLELEESEYNIFNHKTQLNISNRNFESACMNFNLFIGQPIETNYSKIEYELLDRQPVYDLDYYVSSALKNRSEIKSLERQLALKLIEKELLEKNNVHITYTRVAKDWRLLISDINMLELQLKKTKFAINKEVMDIYYNTLEASKDIKKIAKKLDSTKAKLFLVETKIKAGVMEKSRDEQIRLNVKQIEYEVLNTVFNYNTMILRLNNAAMVD